MNRKYCKAKWLHIWNILVKRWETRKTFVATSFPPKVIIVNEGIMQLTFRCKLHYFVSRFMMQ